MENIEEDKKLTRKEREAIIYNNLEKTDDEILELLDTKTKSQVTYFRHGIEYMQKIENRKQKRLKYGWCLFKKYKIKLKKIKRLEQEFILNIEDFSHHKSTIAKVLDAHNTIQNKNLELQEELNIEKNINKKNNKISLIISFLAGCITTLFILNNIIK